MVCKNKSCKILNYCQNHLNEQQLKPGGIPINYLKYCGKKMDKEASPCPSCPSCPKLCPKCCKVKRSKSKVQPTPCPEILANRWVDEKCIPPRKKIINVGSGDRNNRNSKDKTKDDVCEIEPLNLGSENTGNAKKSEVVFSDGVYPGGVCLNGVCSEGIDNINSSDVEKNENAIEKLGLQSLEFSKNDTDIASFRKRACPFTDTFCKFLKKIKSTENFIRDIFKEDCPNDKSTRGVCVEFPCSDDIYDVGEVRGKESKCGKIKDLNKSLDGYKSVKCKLKKDKSDTNIENETKKKDAIINNILAELENHVDQDKIDRVIHICTQTEGNEDKDEDNNLDFKKLIMNQPVCPFSEITCIGCCDMHGTLIIRWKVFSYLGIGGYEIHIDGDLKQRICSAIRNTAHIQGVNIYVEHLVTLTAVPLPNCNLNCNDNWTTAKLCYRPQ